MNPSDNIKRLSDLLGNPREDLDIEIKSWLDIENNKDHMALLAKGLIALANHGGGFLIIGFQKSPEGHTYSPDPQRPKNLNLYDQDKINGIVRRYAEPAFHCTVNLVDHPSSHDKFPIISVPGEFSVPIRTKGASPDGKTLLNNQYYIRRPGPSSENPQNGKEWDELIRKCLKSSREDLLDSIRNIFEGVTIGKSVQSPLEFPLEKWKIDCLERWHDLVDHLPKEDPAKFEKGSYSCAYEIIGDVLNIDLGELKHKLMLVPKFSGWSPFAISGNSKFDPYPYENSLECWLGDKIHDIAYADFWKASTEGRMYLKRGFQEDTGLNDSRVEPGTIFDVTLPIWRVSECMLHSAGLAELICEDVSEVKIKYIFNWEGLMGRELQVWADPLRRFFFPGNYISHQENFEYMNEFPIKMIRENLPEVVFSILKNLYELFGLFKLTQKLVADEIGKMRRR